MNEYDPLLVWARDVRAISRPQAVLRLITFASPLGALMAGDQASPTGPATGFVAFVIALAAITAVLPDSHVGIVLLSVFAVYWAGAVEDPGTPWALVAAVLLLVFHASAAAASTTPARATPDDDAIRRWLTNVGAVTAVVAGAWGVVAAATADDAEANVGTIAAALALIVVFGLLIMRRSTS